MPRPFGPEVADGVRVVEAQVALVGLEDLEVLGDRGDDPEGREDAVRHDQGDVAGLEVGLELAGQVLGVAVLEGVDRLEGRVDGVADAEVGGLVDEDGPDLGLEGLDEEEVVEVARDEVDRILGPEELGDLSLELDLDGRVAEAGPRRGAVGAVLAESGDAGLDDLGVAVEGEIAGAAEVEAALAVDDRLRARGALHDPAAGRRRGLAEGRLVVGEETAEGVIEDEQPGQGLRQELPPARHLNRQAVRRVLLVHVGPPSRDRTRPAPPRAPASVLPGT